MPTYCPTVRGVQALEYSGVVCAVKKTMFISFMPIIISCVEWLSGVADGILMPLIDMVEDIGMSMGDRFAGQIEI